MRPSGFRYYDGQMLFVDPLVSILIQILQNFLLKFCQDICQLC